MTPPETITTIDFPTSTIWFDADGVLYSVPKPGIAPMNREGSQVFIDRFRELIDNKKICMITQTSGSDPMPGKADREWIAAELESMTKAMAILFTSFMGWMMANPFFGIMPAKYPVKFFSNENDARDGYGSIFN